MTPVFRDPGHQAAFERQGFVRAPLVGAAEVDRLRQLFASSFGRAPGDGFVSSSYHPDVPLKLRVSAAAVDVVRPALESLFSGVRILGSAFLYKRGPGSALPVHQDWTIVDETTWVAANVWLPLDDVGPDNGALAVVPGSHRELRQLRAPTLPMPFEGHEEWVAAQCQPQHGPAGTAVILNQAVVHGSPANRTEATRLALTIGIVSAAAPLLFHYADPARPGEVEVFAQADDFLNRFEDFGAELRSRPRRGSSVGWRAHDVQPLDPPEVERRLRRGMAAARRRVLRDPALDEELRVNGFVVLPWLEEAEVDELRRACDDMLPADGPAFFASSRAADRGLRRRASELVSAALRPAFERHFADMTLLGGALIAKRAGGGGALPLHQDWNLVDEWNHRSCAIWVPLVDTSEENGTIRLLAGSHRLAETVRGPGLPDPWAGRSDLAARAEPLCLRRGLGLVYDHALLHSSGPNHSTAARPVAVAGAIPVEAGMRLYHRVDGCACAFEARPETFLEEDPERGPGDARRLGEVPYPPTFAAS